MSDDPRETGDAPASDDAPSCFLHPDRPALLKCTRCERPMCGADAIEAPVGYQCPQCASGGQPVRRLADLAVDARVTKSLLVVIAALFVITQVDRGQVLGMFGLMPAAVGTGAWWLLLTSGFLHANLMHVAFNGILLWRLGEMLEPPLGHARFAALYTFGLAGGSFGVMALSWLTVVTPLPAVPLLGTVLATHPLGITVGASGAVFGLMGAAVIGMRDRGVNPWRTDIGTLVLLNLGITFLVPGISVGGHVGGLLAGMAAGRLLMRKSRRSALTIAGLALLLAIAAALLGRSMLTSVGL